ncbi:LCP family protein [Ornithinimicrobium sediminis]|uniref:LCP family protein n=1 Tax=Ornithinimicrobium sediminis TaxID=2904603 RepID=UPI001E5330F1|nr:LCP family protein [Ornithinimicrobium sediminis]MCE0487512.1 LCP family protein [Ornithinimicrobium sediminis]
MPTPPRRGDVGDQWEWGDGHDFPQTRREHREQLHHPVQPTGPTTRAAQMRRAYTLTALGTVIPGLGLTMTPRRRLGVVMLAVALVVLVVVALWTLTNGVEETVLGLGARPEMLQTVGIIAAGLVLLWMGSVAMTALLSRPRRMTGGQRLGLTTFTLLMCGLLAAPAAMGLRYIDAHSDAVDQIFVGREDTERNEGLAAPDLSADDPWEDTPRVNVLLLGTDAADEREGVRTDSMMVASVNTDTGDTVLFGIPRNLQNVPIPATHPLSAKWPNGFDCGSECLMNAIWTEAEAHAEENPELYLDDPNPGRTATQAVIGAVLGQPMDYHVIVNLAGFQDLIDAMGGVDINVQERLPMGGRTTTDANGNPMLVPGSESGWLEVGEQHLSGYQAMWYARSRITTDDFSRMRRQRCVVAAVLDQVNPLTMAQRYPAIVGVAGDNVKSDVSQGELPAWADLVLRVQDGTITSLPFTIKNVDVVDPDYADIRDQVYLAMHPEQAPEPTQTATPTDTTTPSETVEETTGEPTEDDAPATPTEDKLEEVGAVC